MTTVKPGKIVSCDRTQARYEVEVSGTSVSFGATSFHSGRPTRSPKPGDNVEVVFVGDATTSQTVLYVRLRRE